MLQNICSRILFSCGRYNYSEITISQLTKYLVGDKLKGSQAFIDLISRIRNNISNPFIYYQYDTTSNLLHIRTLNKSYIVIYRNMKQFTHDNINQYILNAITKYDKCIPYILIDGLKEEVPEVMHYCFPDIIVDNVAGDKLFADLKNGKILDKKDINEIILCPQVIATYCSINTFYWVFYLFNKFIDKNKNDVYVFNNPENLYVSLIDRIENHCEIQSEIQRFAVVKPKIGVLTSNEIVKHREYSKHVRGYFSMSNNYRNKILIDYEYNPHMMYMAPQDTSICCLPTDIPLCYSKSYNQHYMNMTLIEKILFVVYNNILMIAFIVIMGY